MIRACFSVLESDWSFYGIDNYSRLTIAKTACIMICGYYAALRGEEIGMSDLGAIRKYWKEATSHPDFGHIPLVLGGTFKGETGLK